MWFTNAQTIKLIRGNMGGSGCLIWLKISVLLQFIHSCVSGLDLLGLNGGTNVSDNISVSCSSNQKFFTNFPFNHRKQREEALFPLTNMMYTSYLHLILTFLNYVYGKPGGGTAHYVKYSAFRDKKGKIKEKKTNVLEIWLASGRQRGRQRTCTLPGNCSETRHCDWGMGSGKT